MAYRARNSAGPRPPPYVSLSLALSTFVSSIPLAWLSPFMASFPPFPFLLSLSPHPFRPTASRSYISLPPSHSLLRRSRCSVLLSFSSVVSLTCLPPLPPLSLRPSPVPLRCAQSPTRFSSSSLASQATRLVHGKLIVSRSPAALVFVSGFDILPFLLLASVSSNVHSSIVFARHDHFLFPTRYIYIYACLLSIKQFIRILYIYIFIRSINRRIAFQMRLKLFR